MSSRGRSPMKAKQKAAQARPYPNADVAMRYEPCDCDPKPRPIKGWLIDWFAEQQMTGGFRYGVCPDCGMSYSAAGMCDCWPPKRTPRPVTKRRQRRSTR